MTNAQLSLVGDRLMPSLTALVQMLDSCSRFSRRFNSFAAAFFGLCILGCPLGFAQQARTPLQPAATAKPETSESILTCAAAVNVDGGGRVSIGCPKVWRSARVFSVLDGIMRDVDSMTILALQGLDANGANQAALDVIQNSFDVTAKFDQAQALNNQLKLQKLKAVRTAQLNSFKADSEF